jgi:parvulin-like peptidyl-prolyl isomerase
MKYQRLLLSSLLVPLAISATSCTKREDQKVAEFKDRAITVGEFEAAYQRVDPKYLPKKEGLDGKIEFVNTMLNREVMSYKADELGYDKDPAVVQGMEAYRRIGLQAGYLKRRVADKVTVSEKEIQQHYELLGSTVRLRQIVLDAPEEAEYVHDLLEDGNDFQTVCREYSKGPDASEGGNILTMVYGKTLPVLQKVLWATDVGSFTEPLYSPYGFLICQVMQKTEGLKSEPLEEVRERVEQEVRGLKELAVLHEMTDNLRDEYGVEWYWDGLRTCFLSLPPDRNLTNPPRRSEEVYPLLLFEEIDLDRPVVSYKDKMIAVKDFSDFYDQASFFTRPRKEYRVAGVRTFLIDRIMNEIVMDEMERSKIEDDPDVARVLNAKREELMLNRLYDDMIAKQTVVTLDEALTYYQENESAFVLPEKRRFGVILTNDYESAKEAYDKIRARTRFRTVVMEYSIDEGTKRTMGETAKLNDGEQPEIDRVGFQLPRVGAVSEPFQTSRGWMILKLTEKEDARVFSFEEVRAQIDSALKELKNETRLNELLAQWKEELGVTIHEDRLREARIVERTTETPTEAKKAAKS